jgi:hypothetical protein
VLESRIDIMRQPLEQREIRDCGNQTAEQNDLQSADPVRQRAEHQEERRADHQRDPETGLFRQVSGIVPGAHRSPAALGASGSLPNASVACQGVAREGLVRVSLRRGDQCVRKARLTAARRRGIREMNARSEQAADTLLDALMPKLDSVQPDSPLCQQTGPSPSVSHCFALVGPRGTCGHGLSVFLTPMEKIAQQRDTQYDRGAKASEAGTHRTSSILVANSVCRMQNLAPRGNSVKRVFAVACSRKCFLLITGTLHSKSSNERRWSLERTSQPMIRLVSGDLTLWEDGPNRVDEPTRAYRWESSGASTTCSRFAARAFTRAKLTQWSISCRGYRSSRGYERHGG